GYAPPTPSRGTATSVRPAAIRTATPGKPAWPVDGIASDAVALGYAPPTPHIGTATLGYAPPTPSGGTATSVRPAAIRTATPGKPAWPLDGIASDAVALGYTPPSRPTAWRV